ncbi:MAG: arginine deiminase family protein [Bacteroidales bacterium]|jgi:arginine deiminase|nr:arginine deiminase family protein [Bacteroidales bacterium]
MEEKINVQVSSEIGDLEAAILHTPGHEVENMTPQNAERALYSDILNLTIASQEYSELHQVLNKLTKTFQVKDLLLDILENKKVKESMIHRIVLNEQIESYEPYLSDLDNAELARQLIEGGEMIKNNLTRFLDPDRFSLKPLHNFFFTRDASMTVNNKVLIGKMASKVRDRESLIMESIFDSHPLFNTTTVNPLSFTGKTDNITIEGGDVLVARKDILLIGLGPRTTSQGIDFVIECLKNTKERRHIIVQELPHSPESFIHLDMVFTFLDKDKCMVYEPVILQTNRFQTIHITIDGGKVESIKDMDNIIVALKTLGMDLEPLYCGGSIDKFSVEREQWHSGTNFFAVAPGKVIGYGRNEYTINEMNKRGFDVLKAQDVIQNKIKLSDYQKYVITIDGSELARGGGGARCMTMPVARKAVDW